MTPEQFDAIVHHARVVERYENPALRPLSRENFIIYDHSRRELDRLRQQLANLEAEHAAFSNNVEQCEAENDRLRQRVAEAARDAARYRYVRTLNPHEFDSLVRRNIRDDLAFDSLVDAALQERKP